MGMDECPGGCWDAPHHGRLPPLPPGSERRACAFSPRNDTGSGFAFLDARSDKGQSFTDCLSFLIMEQRGIGRALTSDRHFQQAGFPNQNCRE